MVLEVLKYILLVLGIVAVGALILWGLVTIILKIVEPHENNEGTINNQREQQITYEPQKLITSETTRVQEVSEPVVEEYISTAQEDMVDIDEQKALEEEKALMGGTSFGELSAEEEEFLKEKQRKIEERMAEKQIQEEPEEELDLDNIFIDDDELEEEKDEDGEEDIEELINKILDGKEEINSVEEAKPVEETKPAEEVNVDEEVLEVEEELVDEPAQEEQISYEEQKQDESAVEDVQQVQVEEAQQNNNEEFEQKVRELEEQLARQKEEYEARLQEAESEKAKLIAESENREEKTAGALSLEEYEARLEVLKERLKNNEKDLKPVKKEYIPLAKIKARLEKDNTKLRRKEALVAKQKVVLYGVNNYVDIDEEKAKKLAEDLDLLEGLRLSVQHCEEVMKANEERFPILENAYNSLIETNTHIKADIEECNKRIAELKAEESNN